MARYLAPNQIKGSFGGATFQRCGKVFAIRKHNVPTDKKRIKQFTARNLFEHVQGKWRDLSPIQQASFAAETINYPRINSIGEVYEMSAINLQNSSNTNLINASQSPIDQMPAPVVCPLVTINNVFINYNTQEAEFELDIAFVPAGFALFVFSATPQPPGVDTMRIESMKLFKVFAPNDDTAVNIFSYYTATFGANPYPVGHKVFAIFQLVSTDTGQKCPEIQHIGFVE